MSMPSDKNYFQIYKGDCDCFVETGTYQGNGVTLAVQAGFLEIHTIDLKDNKDPNYKHGLKNINYYYGDSATVFEDELFVKINTRKAMFWLDAHSQLLEGEEENYPLLRELKVLAKYRKGKDDVILIDDFLYMSHPLITGWNHKQIENAVREINPKYKIEYLSNPIRNNILLARV